MTDNLSLEEMMPLIKEKIAAGGEVTFTVTGNSMLPMLHDRVDTVTLVPPVFPLKKHDLPFYCRQDGKYILHRLVRIKDGNYIIRGDNCNYTELGITDADIIGTVKSFTRKGKTYSVDGRLYHLYCALWTNEVCFFFRKRLIIELRAAGGKAKRKLKKLLKK